MANRLPRHAGHKRTPKYIYNFEKRQDAQTSCTTQTVYKAPAAASVVDSMAGPVVFSWDTACWPIPPQTIDVRLYAPHVTNVSERRLQYLKDVPFAAGQVSVELYPRWWKNAATAQLQFAIMESGNPFSSYYGPGPEFTATYTAVEGSNDDRTNLNIFDSGYISFKNYLKGLSGGQIAGVVFGILAFIGFVIGGLFYIRRARAKRTEQSKRFSQMVDKRMSTISQNWSSISPTGAQAAIRNSMSVYGRPSGDLSMQSSLSLNNNSGHDAGNTVGVGLRPQRERNGTRVSFAPESMYGRPSSSIRNSAVSNPNRPFHYADAPPMPVRQNSENMTLSPTQAVGAFEFSPQEVDARASQYNPELMPALQLMRESNGDSAPMFSHKDSAPLPPVPAMTAPSSSVGVMGMMPMVDSNLSPDALLRGYATNKDSTMRRTGSISVATGPVTPLSPINTGPTYPTPVAARTLYTPSTPTRVDNNPFRKSIAPTLSSVYDGVYDGVDSDYEQQAQHHHQASSQQRLNRI